MGGKEKGKHSDMLSALDKVEEEIKENSPMCLRSKRKIEYKPIRKKSKVSKLEESNGMEDTEIDSKKEFTSCLVKNELDVMSPTGTCGDYQSSKGTNNAVLRTVLQRAISVEELGEKSWLSSSVIDLVFSKFARCYDNVEYLSMDFILLALNDQSSNFEGVTNILGRTLQYNQSRPIVLLYNSNSIHWTLIRIQYLPEPAIELFEPMGKPQHRNGRLTYRDVPREVIRWLDTCCPLDDGRSWLDVSTSAITKQHQVTSFDCGVACLLYAEKCGLGHGKDDINELTSQEHITQYRELLRDYINKQKLSAF